jgi:hypothetical protein
MDFFAERYDYFDQEGNAERFSLLRLLRGGRFVRLLRIFRLLRILKFKTLSFKNSFDDLSEYSRLILSMIQQSATMLIATHFVCCMWYAVGTTDLVEYESSWVKYHVYELEKVDPTVYSQYLASIHWALTQLTPGTMEVVPVNNLERLFNILVLSVSLVAFSTFVSRMTVEYTQLRNLTGENDKKLSLARKFLVDNDVSQDLVVRINHFFVARLAEMDKHVPESEVELVSHLSTGTLSGI